MIVQLECLFYKWFKQIKFPIRHANFSYSMAFERHACVSRVFSAAADVFQVEGEGWLTKGSRFSWLCT